MPITYLYNNKFKKILPITVFGIFIILLIIFIQQDRLYLSDFKVYYGAARDLLQLPITYGNYTISNTENIYEKYYGLSSGYYKYSPTFALLITPLSLLPWSIASSLYYIIIAILISIIPLYTYTLIQKVRPHSLTIKTSIVTLYSLTILITIQHLYREIWLGNVNLVLLYFLIGVCYSLYYHKQKLTALLLALILITKPHFVSLLVIILLFRHYRLFLYTISYTLILLFIPTFILGGEKEILLMKSWIHTMQTHNKVINLFDDPTTIFYHFKQLFGSIIVSQLWVYSILFGIILIYLGVLYQTLKDKQKRETNSNLIIHLLCMVAAIPNITVTDTEHFLYSLPIIMILITNFRYMKLWAKISTTIAMLFYGGNWHDLLGHHLSIIMTNYGLLGLGNIILISIALLLHLYPSYLLKK